MAPMSPILLDQEDIVRESIIENKERTKSYWEQLMLAAAAAAADDGHTIRASNSNRNSVSSVDSAMTGGSAGEDEELNVKEEKRRIEMRHMKQLSENNNASHEQTMQEKIARELREMREREQELANMRRTAIIPQTEERVSLIDESNCSEYGSDDKEPSLDSTQNGTMQYRAQSMESISSGMSSGSLISSGSNGNGNISCAPKRRQVTVRPFDDPEFEPATTTPVALFSRNDKETPIEREIRLACERENELRQSQGLVSSVAAQPQPTTLVRLRKDALENDTRGVQRRIATNRIQQEIEEACEREMELRTEGKILTTSLETVDNKVTRFTQIAQAAMQTQSQNRTIRRATSQNNQLDQENVLPLRRAVSTSTLTANPQGGFMGRFIASQGRLSIKVAPLQPEPQPQAHQPLHKTDDEEDAVRHDMPMTRNGFISAEEKIQSELRDMQRREEEWRRQRSHALARSQPNLLAIDDEQDRGDGQMVDGQTGHDNSIAQPTSLPTHYSSNPNLTDSQQYQTKLFSFNQRGCRKRFSLIDEWENRIQKEL